MTKIRIIPAVIALFAFATFSIALNADPLKVGLILDKGGKDDKSFNAAAFQGATNAEKKFKIALKTVESSDDAGIEPSMRTFARHKYDLIIGIGFAMADPMKKVAKEFPDIKFLLVDSEANAPNIRSVTFQEHEGSFLVGAIAALTTKTNTVGFIGGMDVPLIRRFELGYRAGAKHINPKITVLTNYVGASSDAWKNPTKAKELANSQYQKKADIIFAAAGTSGLGVFDAAEESKKFAIGVDSNQNWIKPGLILTSMLKRIDLAVEEAIEQADKKTFKPGAFAKGFSENGVDFAVDNFNRSVLTPAVEKKANELKAQIKSGKIKVPDYYKNDRISRR